MREILSITNFSDTLQVLIMNIVTSTSLRFCWNGELLDAFSSSRGLREGDPLSPYLFVLCIEVLHHHIANAVESKVWKPVCPRRGVGIPMSHLLLFRRVSHSQALVMKNVLETFGLETGQRVNQWKTLI